MKDKDLLLEVRGLLARGHCKRVFARNSEGEATHHHDDDAACFCVMGAIRRTVHLTECGDVDFVEERLRNRIEQTQTVGQDNVLVWNDYVSTTQEKVLQALDEAIASCPG